MVVFLYGEEKRALGFIGERRRGRMHLDATMDGKTSYGNSELSKKQTINCPLPFVYVKPFIDGKATYGNR